VARAASLRRLTIACCLAGLTVASCTFRHPDGAVEIKTGSKDGACALAAVGGVLVADDVNGLAFRGQGHNVVAVFPYGYSARREHDVVFLVDPSGHVIGKEGDEVHGAGAFGDDVIFVMCQLRVVASSTPSST
jgi:hypothetical protein